MFETDRRSQIADRSSGRLSTPPIRDPRSAICLAVALLLFSCHRETRELTTNAAGAQRTIPVRVGELQPGPKMQAPAALDNPYEGNAYALSQGQRLYEQYNCAGCHFHGGGGIGPALMDSEWIYGSSPQNIFMTISEGRPNGMPSYGGHITNEQIWQLVTYVRSVGGFEGRVVPGARTDEMQSKSAEEPNPPKRTAIR